MCELTCMGLPSCPQKAFNRIVKSGAGGGGGGGVRSYTQVCDCTGGQHPQPPCCSRVNRGPSYLILVVSHKPHEKGLHCARDLNRVHCRVLE